MWNGELNSLCCLLGSKQNSLSRAAQTRSLSEACHSRDSFQKLHLPYILTFSAAWFTFKRDYNSLHLSRLWSFYSQNHRQSQTKFLSTCHAGYSLLLSLPITASNVKGLRRVMRPAGTAFSIQRSDAEFFIQVKFSLLLAPMIFSTFLGLCLSSHKWALKKNEDAIMVWFISGKISDGNALCHKSLLSYTISCCTVRRTVANEKTFVYDANTGRKHHIFFIYECFYMKLAFSLFSTTISHLVFITFITYYLLIDNNAQRCLCRVSLGLHRSCTHYLLVNRCSYLVINVKKGSYSFFTEGKLP